MKTNRKVVFSEFAFRNRARDHLRHYRPAWPVHPTPVSHHFYVIFRRIGTACQPVEWIRRVPEIAGNKWLSEEMRCPGPVAGKVS